MLGAGHLARLTIAPAAELGIDLLLLETELNEIQKVREFSKLCDVITIEQDSTAISVLKSLEADGAVVRPSSTSFRKLVLNQVPTFDSKVKVMVARSPHGQATTWAPTQEIERDGVCVATITPAPNISAALSEIAQKMALEIALEIAVVGVMTIEFAVIGQELLTNQVQIGLSNSGNWSIEGSRTSQFEQHLRAVLDLPLGDPSLITTYVVTGNIWTAEKFDMYRPYLHLMARTPGLKFHQYKKELIPGELAGHITLLGDDPENLFHEIEHATDYMSGAIDE
jgi:5-(carboxyamino)imidazole ribonucleotide synthase